MSTCRTSAALDVFITPTYMDSLLHLFHELKDPRLLVQAAFPVEAPRAERETVLMRQVRQIADLDDCVLQMGRDDGEIFLVQRDEPQRFHDADLPSCPASRSKR